MLLHPRFLQHLSRPSTGMWVLHAVEHWMMGPDISLSRYLVKDSAYCEKRCNKWLDHICIPIEYMIVYLYVHNYAVIYR